MDRELDQGYRIRRGLKRAAWVVVLLLLAAAIVVLLPGWLRPSVPRELIRTAIVDRGPIEGVVEASGVVIPAFEVVLSSPVEARVEKILKRPGEVVRAGEEILALDLSGSRAELGRLEDSLRKKLNEQEQLRISLAKSLSSLRGRTAAARLDLEALDYRAEQSRSLRREGLISEQVLRAAEVEAKKARIELDQLEAQAASEQLATDAQLRGLELDLGMLRRDQDQARRQLELATTRSSTAGVLTWVVPREGSTVGRGEVIARIADLDAFRVEARISDVHSSRLRAGQAVKVVAAGETLAGRLAQIDPTIESGAIKFTVDLEEPRHAGLRNNLSVDVLVVAEAKADVLRLAHGPFRHGGAVEPVFMIERGRPDRAARRRVRFGLSGYDRDEVVDGLAAGDEVILSDLRDYLDLAWVDLR